MGKWKLSQETREKIRQGRAMYLSPGPESGAPEDWQQRLESDDKKAEGPWKWEETVRIREVVINRGDGETKDGRSVDRWDIKMDVSEDSEANSGRTYTEFLRIADPTPDGSMDKMTEIAFGLVDQMVTAAEIDWVLDDEGDEDPEATVVEELPRCEFKAKFKLMKRKRKDTGEFVPDCSIQECRALD